jgi:aspartate aminotransferase-like enzyme
MLMIPGPTPVPENVLLALAKHPIGHRSGEFSQIMADVTANLKWLHQTQNDVLMLTVSGTDVVEVTAPWGQPIDPTTVKAALDADTAKAIKGVIVTHSETSTGVINDLETINNHVKAHGALIIVDAVTSLGAVNVPIDEWGLDVVCSGSQKGFMIPPGLGFVTVSPKAWEAYKVAKLPRFYMDLGPYSKGQLDFRAPSRTQDDESRGTRTDFCPSPTPHARHPCRRHRDGLAPIRARRTR